MKGSSLLSVQNLSVSFRTEDGVFQAVSDVSFGLKPKEMLGIVGESGSGKSVTALSIMRLIPPVVGSIDGGQITFLEQNLFQLNDKEMRRLRGNRISMIFQEPMTSLNPVFTIGDQIMEAIRLHQRLGKKEALKKCIEMLELVGIPAPSERVSSYPHQLSGGMRQRVMIAMALSCKPDVLIADEPTTALDVTIQAQIMELLKRLQTEFSMGVILITHDLGIVAETCDRMAVMYAGQIVEEGDVKDIFTSPRHPYTIGLLNSIPGYSKNISIGPDGKPRLSTIPGMVPHLSKLKDECRFLDRCFKAQRNCSLGSVSLDCTEKGRQFRCLYPEREILKAPLELSHG